MPTAAGIHYFLHEGGSGTKPPLVLIHGAGGDHLSWPAEVRRLPGTRVYTLDLPGHGKTGGHGRQSVEDYAGCVLDFMNGAGLDRAIFGGHEMGGAIALMLSLKASRRAAGLVLISMGARLPIPPAVLENGTNASTLQVAINILEELSFSRSTPAEMREAFCERMLQVRQTLLYGDWLACDHFDASDRLEEVKSPTLVLCGKEDRLSPLHFSESLSSRIPGAALQTIEEAGHMLLLEQPRQLAKLMGVFLLTIPFRPGG